MNPPKRARLTLALVALALVGLGGLGYALGDDARPSGRLFWASSGGGVLFDHEAHGAAVGECAACHHELVVGGGYASCKECHGDEDYSRDDGMSHDDILGSHEGQEMACSACHTLADENQARACGSCHEGEAVAATSDKGCAACHDEDEMSYGDFADHGEMLQTHVDADEPLSCGQCHGRRSRSDAFHEQCSECHLREARERFADDEGRPQCARCHLK